MKTLKALFAVSYCGSQISYSSRNLTLRVGKTDVAISEADLADLENCSKHDIQLPMQIFWRNKAE